MKGAMFWPIDPFKFKKGVVNGATELPKINSHQLTCNESKESYKNLTFCEHEFIALTKF